MLARAVAQRSQCFLSPQIISCIKSYLHLKWRILSHFCFVCTEQFSHSLMFIPPRTHELSATFLYLNGSSLGLCYLKGIFFTSNVPRVPRNSKSTDQFSSVQFFVFLSICESDYIDCYFCSLFLSKLFMIEIAPQNFFSSLLLLVFQNYTPKFLISIVQNCPGNIFFWSSEEQFA